MCTHPNERLSLYSDEPAGTVIPSGAMVDALESLVKILQQTTFWATHEIVVIRLELHTLFRTIEKRQAGCLFDRHPTETKGMCTSRCLSCGDYYCHCMFSHCCCPRTQDVEHEKEKTIVLGRMRLQGGRKRVPQLRVNT